MTSSGYRAYQEPASAVLDVEEQAAMNDLLGAYKRICGWGLQSNSGELASAVHVIQGFIVQRMLHRLTPDAWSSWYEEPFVAPARPE